MAKKKMTKAQAAAARRPDDWEPPQNAPKKKAREIEIPSTSPPTSLNDKEGWKPFVPFIILFVVMGIAAPFLVVFFSNAMGIS